MTSIVSPDPKAGPKDLQLCSSLKLLYEAPLVHIKYPPWFNEVGLFQVKLLAFIISKLAMPTPTRYTRDSTLTFQVL